MMFKGSGTQGDLNGFLDAGSHMTGELKFEDTFRIDGRFTGKVFSGGDLIVGEHGEVDGEVEVSRVHVSGTVRGTVRAPERLDVAATGKILADISTPKLTIEEGAYFEGRCSMGKRDAEVKGDGREKVARMPLAKKLN